MEPRVSAQPRANFLPWDWPSWLVKWLSFLFSPAVNSILLVGYLDLKGRAGNVMDSKLQVPSTEGLCPCPRGPTGYSLCPWAGMLAALLSDVGGNLSLLVRQNQQSQRQRANESPHFYLKTKLCPKFLGTLENTKNGHKGWVVLGSQGVSEKWPASPESQSTLYRLQETQPCTHCSASLGLSSSSIKWSYHFVELVQRSNKIIWLLINVEW